MSRYLSSRKALIVVFILIFTAAGSTACAQEEVSCVFEERGPITVDLVESRSDILHFSYKEDSNEFLIISKEAEFVYIKSWGCTSYGAEGKNMIVGSDERNRPYWMDRLLEFAGAYMDASAFSFFKESIDMNVDNGGEEIEIDLSGKNPLYPEFMAGVREVEDTRILYFYYYQN